MSGQCECPYGYVIGWCVYAEKITGRVINLENFIEEAKQKCGVCAIWEISSGIILRGDEKQLRSRITSD